MAHHVNWWLMALAFVLGLLLTLALTIRKVTREVPVTHTLAAGIAKPYLGKAGAVGAAGAAAVAGAGATLKGAVDKVDDAGRKFGDKVDDAGRKFGDKVDKAGHEVGAKVEAAGRSLKDKAADAAHRVERRLEPDILEEDPYGSGSIRVSARTVGPAGYTIKGDKDTGRYFTQDSPDYADIEAEVWFANEESAEKAGFLRWNAKGERRQGFLSAESAAVINDDGIDESARLVIKDDGIDESANLVINDDGIDESANLVIKDDGIDESARLVVHDDGYADADADAVVREGGPARAAGTARPAAQGSAAGKGSSTRSGAEDATAPYGKGSARAGAGGTGPAGWLIKGNADSMLFHGPDSPYYERTIAEVWFLDEATARAAGFDKWDKNID